MDEAAEYERVMSKYAPITARHVAAYGAGLGLWCVVCVSTSVSWTWEGPALLTAALVGAEITKYRVRRNAMRTLRPQDQPTH